MNTFTGKKKKKKKLKLTNVQREKGKKESGVTARCQGDAGA